jgi:capsular exopolysaccharide synthesis family protein
MIEQFQDTGLYVLTSGPWTDNPAELLASDRIKRLIDSLRSQFSYVIIDSPPIRFFTDAVLVSSMVDGVLLVVRGPKTPQQGKYSVYSLDNVGAPILGIVLNDVDIDSTNNRYYRNYYGSSNEPRESPAQLLGIG